MIPDLLRHRTGKNIILTLLLAFTPCLVYPQGTGYYQSFDGSDLRYWGVDLNARDTTFLLSADNNTMKIQYSRTATSAWDNVHFYPSSPINVLSNPMITLRLRSTVNTSFAAKMVFDDGTDTGLRIVSIVGDDTWKTVSLQYPVTGSPRLARMYFYFDGGTSLPKSGIIHLDDFRVGDSAYFVPDYANLERARTSVQNLLLHSAEGSGEGMFPAGSKSVLQSALNQASGVLNSGSKSQSEVDNAIWNLYDACATFERSVNSVRLALVDPLTTKQTRYLYLNLNRLAHNSLLFGMQNATGFGYGWSGDDDRSDIKDVCGDYPAVFSEDINQVELNQDLDRLRYRLTSAYNRGAVITLVWHQYDPGGRGFYSTDVNNERIVSTILPGGAHHQQYKDKLKKISLFLKSLRGVDGESIPVIFRPYHEHVGDWFWWGPASTTTQEYNDLWRFTARYFIDSLNVHNMLWALSPSLEMIAQDTAHENYFTVYPGNDYVDLFGADYYFESKASPLTSADVRIFSGYMNVLAAGANRRDKLTAITEVGQEFIPTPNWFTDCILAPIKNDTLNSSMSYAALWFNYDATQYWAPFPGQSSVPNFLQFYNDPYTLFTSDLPPMYQMPLPDTLPPLIVSHHDSVYVSVTSAVSISVVTNERAYARYSGSDEPYEQMPHQFVSGEGGFTHEIVIPSQQGQSGTIYVRAKDIAGNTMKQSTMIRFRVDTLEAPVPWYALNYPVTSWGSGKTPLGTSLTDSTRTQNVRTVYTRKQFPLSELPTAAAIVVKGYGGCAVYLNDREISRYNLPTGSAVEYTADPLSGSSYTKQLVLDSTALRSFRIGDNIFAVETHALPPAYVQGFDAYVINQNNVKIFALGSVWTYFDKGYRPSDIKTKDIVSVSDAPSLLPRSNRLYQNYPNPFNPATSIQFDLVRSTFVKIEVFDILGRRIAVLSDEVQAAGTHIVPFDGRRLTSGIYFVRMHAGDYIKTNKMVLLK